MRTTIALLTALLFLLPLNADADKKDKKKKAEDLRVTVEIPISGMRNDGDAQYLRKVLKQKLGTRAESDVVGRSKVLLKVEQGCQVSLVDLKRVFEKVARKRRIPLRIGDPQLRGRVEIATKMKRQHPTRVKSLMTQLKQIKGVVPQREDSKSLKRVPLEVKSKDVRLAAIQVLFARTLGVRDRGLFRDVIWHGPAGGGERAAKAGTGGADPPPKPKTGGGYKPKKGHSEVMVMYGSGGGKKKK